MIVGSMLVPEQQPETRIPGYKIDRAWAQLMGGGRQVHSPACEAGADRFYFRQT